MKRAIVFILLALAGLTFLLPGLYRLGMVGDDFLYFYKGSFILCSEECFVENGQLMYYEGLLGNTYVSISVFFIAAIIAAVITVLSFMGRVVKKAIQK